MLDSVKALFFKHLYAISLYARQIAGTIVILFIARYLSVFDYGLFSSYKTIATFGLMFANLGFNEYILISSQNLVKEVQLKIGLFMLNAILLAILIGTGGLFSPVENKLIFILVVMRTFFDSTFFGLMLPYFQASKRFNIISCVNIFYSLSTIIIATVSYIFHLSLIKFLLMSILLGIINFLQVSFYAGIKYLLSFKYYKKILQKIDSSIFTYSGVTLCWYLYNQLPSLFTSTFVPKKEAALYFSALTVASIIALLLSAQVQKMMPELIKAPVDKIKQILKENLKFLLTVNTIVFLFFAFFGKTLLKLIYSKTYYISAYPILLILTLANISIAIAAIFGAYITASGNQKIKIKMQLEAIIISIITLSLFYKFGIYTATLAYLLSATHIGIRYVLKTKELLAKIQST